MDQISNDLIGHIVTLAIALIAAIPGFLGYRSAMAKDKRDGFLAIGTSKKTEAEATEVLISGAVALLDPLKERVRALEEKDEEREREMYAVRSELYTVRLRLNIVEKNNRILCEGVRNLIAQIKSLGENPVFELEDDICEKMESNGQEDTEKRPDHLT